MKIDQDEDVKNGDGGDDYSDGDDDSEEDDDDDDDDYENKIYSNIDCRYQI